MCTCIFINPRRACTARATVVGFVCVYVCVCVCVCLSVCLSKSHLTSGASAPPEINVMYSTGNEGQKFVGFSLKLLRCGDPALPPSYGDMYRRPFFTHLRYTYEHAHTGSYAHTGSQAPRVCTLVLFIGEVVYRLGTHNC